MGWFLEAAGRRRAVLIVLAISAACSSAAIAGAEIAPPGEPTSPTAAAGPGGGEITVDWSAPTLPFPSVSSYRVYRGTTSPADGGARDDDGTRESFINIDNFDDTGIKHLVLPPDALKLASSAKLWIFAQSVNCNYRGQAHRLYVNGVSTLDFDRCDKWASTGYSWQSFDVPLSRLRSGTDNTVEIRIRSGFTVSYKLNVGIDATNDFSRSEAVQNNVDYPGELMWYLTIPRLAPNNDAVQVAEVNTTVHVDGGLGNGRSAYYYVVAVNDAGTSTRTPDVAATTFDLSGAPQSLQASRGPGYGQVSVSWLRPPPNGQPEPRSYSVYRGQAPEALSFIASVTGTAFVDSGLAPATAYAYSVTAVNPAGEGPAAPTAQVTTYAAALPAAPATLAAVPGGGKITVRWFPPPANDGPPPVGFRIYRGSSDGTSSTGPAVQIATAGSGATAYADAPLGNVESYYYSITAVNEVGEGPASPDVHATTFGLPGSPSALVLAGDHCNSRVNLSWSAPSSDGGTPVTGYRVFRSAGTSAPTAIGTTTSPSFTDGAAPRDQLLGYTVSAQNAAGESQPSSPVEIYLHSWGCYRFAGSDEGFATEQDQPASQVAWAPGAGWIQLHSQRSDPGDEVFSRTLGTTFDSATADFSLSARWSTVTPGWGQGAVPIYLSGGRTTKITEQPGSVFFYFTGGDLDSGRAILMRYRDAGGRLRINGPAVQFSDTAVVLTADYSSATRVLTLRVKKTNGQVIASSSYTVGSNPGDGFAFRRVGVATQGFTAFPDYPLTASVDDIFIAHRGAAPVNPQSLSVSASAEGPVLTWTASPYDGGSAAFGYRIYRRQEGGSEILLATVGPEVLGYTDLAPGRGVFHYRVAAINQFGEGDRAGPATGVSAF